MRTATGCTPSSLLEPVRGLPAARRQTRGLAVTAHRPWPVPSSPWVMGQTWERLLFAHWAVPAGALRCVVPAVLPLDEFDGSAWIGITPFVVRALRPRALPPPPFGSAFPELNVRTYVTVRGRPGIFFFSLDAASPLAVAGARLTYRLPYFHAEMRADRRGQRTAYRSRRRTPGAPPARLDAEYEPAGPVFTAARGTLEHFLTERYCLYRVDGAGRTHSADIHHPPWPLQAARATVAVNTMAAQLGLELAPADALVHYAGRQDVVVWPTRIVG